LKRNRWLSLFLRHWPPLSVCYPSDSLTKGTALRSLNDIDVAVYIQGADAPRDVRALLDCLTERLRKAFPNFSPDQVKPQTYSVTVSLKGSLTPI